MQDHTRAFRDYATRISFNLSLSRNQVGHLASVLCEIENEALAWDDRTDKRKDACEEAGGRPSLFVVGRGSLVRMGLIEHDPRHVAEEARLDAWRKKHPVGYPVSKYNGPRYTITAAGAHVIELLRIAGLLPKAAVNDSRRKTSAKAVA